MAAGLAAATCASKQPSVHALACPRVGTLDFAQSVPDRKPFPRTQVDLCYTNEHLEVRFTAYDEVNFYFNESHGTNDDIWAYEVMEAFIHMGTGDPQTYLEFEVSPNNVTYQAFVYNPSKDRSANAPFDHFFVTDPAKDGFSAVTELNRTGNIWKSNVKIPLGLFNVNKGAARGTKWRMNFFRTVVSPTTYPNQELGAWSSPLKASFHITECFGKVLFL
ncbi:hypothetical protein HRG_005101 [Hirsutella rhossiliensis]|uniref:Carbohydrate-binding domain-containing protein n=1 Tax=Hirsutella rhossiliensis TaxID=111463 RepID=A0A9P8MYG6_9HYPO|nr:uncharacterized protein HRG_05101 [Hirsutella rhossiliensis]KAH0964673.1 hypothetical protein HRG_05101 [Hirsutella rhossiliensis]